MRIKTNFQIFVAQEFGDLLTPLAPGGPRSPVSALVLSNPRLVFPVIEVACGEHGEDRIDVLVAGTDNGKSVRWFENYTEVAQERRKSEGEVASSFLHTLS